MHQEEQEQKGRVAGAAICAVDGCTEKRKHGVVGDLEHRACGMDHLRILEQQSGSGPVAVRELLSSWGPSSGLRPHEPRNLHLGGLPYPM